MKKIVFSPEKELVIKNFTIISSLDLLFEIFSLEDVSFIALPAGDEGAEIIDYLLHEEKFIPEVYIYGIDVAAKLKLFFTLAQGYQMLGFKGNITMKHNTLEKILK